MASEQRLIDTSQYKQFLKRYIKELYEVDAHMIAGAVERCLYKLEAQPTVDAVEVVRCKDCKHYDNTEGICWCKLNSKFYLGGFDWHSFPEDGFCSYGERKDNERKAD